MNCGKCGGKVFVDRMFSENANPELMCIACGKRWFLKRANRFTTWLEQTERKLGTSI